MVTVPSQPTTAKLSQSTLAAINASDGEISYFHEVDGDEVEYRVFYRIREAIEITAAIPHAVNFEPVPTGKWLPYVIFIEAAIAERGTVWLHIISRIRG